MISLDLHALLPKTLSMTLPENTKSTLLMLELEESIRMFAKPESSMRNIDLDPML